MIKIWLLSLTLLFTSYSKAVEVIVHNSVNIDTLTVTQLRRIYAMRQVLWANNAPIIVYALPSKNELHQTFSKHILRMFPYQLDRIWHKLTYSGVGNGPIIVANEKSLLQAVMSTPGAIGYINKQPIPVNGSVKIVKIKGVKQ